MIRMSVPLINATTIDGAPVSTRVRGKIVAIALFGTWCVPCRHELPILQARIAQQHPEVLFIAIGAGDDADALRSYRAAEHFTFLFVADPDFVLFRRFRGTDVPRLYVTDQDGTIRTEAHGIGELTATLRTLQLLNNPTLAARARARYDEPHAR